MKRKTSTGSRFVVALSACFTVLAATILAAPATATTFYVQTNLVSDIPGLAKVTDPRLVNPWGMSSSATSPIWVSDNGTGLATLYNGAGVPQALVVTIPPSGAGTPTGQVFNGGSNFSSQRFLFSTEDGTIAGFNGSTTAVLDVLNVSGTANYKGLAINNANNLLYAANFGSGAIDVFGPTFNPMNLGAGAFTDPTLPAGYAPFNIQDLGGSLYVTYAVVNPMDPHDDLPGPGNGIVDVYTETGTLVLRLITGGVLDSPWGLALAPPRFGEYSGDLLVGNFGDGLIHAFDPTSGAQVGALEDINGNPITIDGLWGLKFGTNSANGGGANVLFFTAGIPGPRGQVEDHGLFGTLAVPEPASAALLGIGLAALGALRRRRV